MRFVPLRTGVRVGVCVASALGSLLLSAGGFPWAGTGTVPAEARAAQDQQPPVFRGGTAFVYLDVYPRIDGQVIEGLTPADFEVTEDGKPQSVETFQFIRFETSLPDEDRRDPTSVADSERQAADPNNRLFVVYLDPYHTTVEGAYNVRSAVMAFLTRTIGRTDLFGVTTAEASPSQLTFGRRLETLENDLDDFFNETRLDGTKKDLPRNEIEFRLQECLDPDDAGGRKAVVQRHREDLLMNSLEGLLVRLRDLREERKNVLFISEGWVPEGRMDSLTARVKGDIPQISVSPRGRLGTGNQQPYGRDNNWCDQQLGRLANLDFEDRFRQLLTRAREANVSFYPVDVGGLRVSGSSGARDTLLTLAENTDGIAITNTNDVTGAVRRLTSSLSAMYLLGYYSTNSEANGRYRSIRVRVKRPNVDVSARPGYFAPTAEMLAASRAAPPPPPTAVDEEFGRLARARPDAELFGYGTRAGDMLSLVAELSSREMSSGRWKNGAAVSATVSGAGGASETLTGRIEAGQRAVTLTAPASAVGAGAAKVMLRVSGDDAFLDDSFEVSPPAGPLFGTPLVFRANPSPRAPIKPVADFQFRRVERVHVEWPVLAPATERAARLLDRRGEALPVEPVVSDREDPGGARVVVDVNLAPLAEGSYVIELTGTAGAERQRELLAFMVVR